MVRLDGLRLTEAGVQRLAGGGRLLTQWHAAALSHADSDLEKASLGPGLNACPRTLADCPLEVDNLAATEIEKFQIWVHHQCKILKTDSLGLSSTESFSNLPVAAPKLCMKCNQRKLKLFHVQYFVLILSLRPGSNFMMICGPIEVFHPHRFCVTQVTFDITIYLSEPSGIFTETSVHFVFIFILHSSQSWRDSIVL